MKLRWIATGTLLALSLLAPTTAPFTATACLLGAFLVTLALHFLERILFFTTSNAPRMPGIP